jgi:tRNA/rRNA methyltransferase
MPNLALSHLRIILVEPAGALNVGSIARVMKNMGLVHLILVNPQCRPDDDEARQMAVHAKDVLKDAQVVASLPEALVGCHRAVATTARERDVEPPLEAPQQVLPWLMDNHVLQEPSPSEPTNTHMLQSALIFGPEDRGLSNDELSYAQRYLKIPTSDIYPSLNLAQAVAICCYELRQLAIAAYHHHAEQHLHQYQNKRSLPLASDHHLQHDTTPNGTLDCATLDELEGFYRHLEDTLLDIGYVLPHTANSRMKKFRQLFNRALLSTAEVSMLRGILRQVHWATTQSDQDSTP